ncbi:hypothetical protein HMPREF9098_0865 [Kingella denitrificans ATCC 33394]|uniref:Uncharacterized protein n=1 Tax=Kingella denitrificans ATCC 33394 TaxID=888741 RepID=F0EYD1_9NEIS|nr:hypothetical protein HMPREF9098_0865 [Kingella denitrificans ATCC 33394]
MGYVAALFKSACLHAEFGCAGCFLHFRFVCAIMPSMILKDGYADFQVSEFCQICR